MNIILIGYMGSGKSTIGQKLSCLLKFNHLDLDVFIEQKENATIPQIFKSKGEIYFRKVESQYLKEVLCMEDTIVSLGGGTPSYGNNMQLILNNCNSTSIYLKASISQLVERLAPNKNTRPLISHLKTEELNVFIGKHLFERSAFYHQAALTIMVDKKSVKEIAEEIIAKLF